MLLLSNSNSVLAVDSNIAPLATVTASSENVSGDQTAIKTVDGVAEGYPANRTAEWRTKGQKVGAWLSLVWSSAHTIDRVVLYDRPNLNDQITSAILSFSDGSSVPVGTLNNDGAAVTIVFSARTVTSLLLTVTGVSGTTTNIGLAEIEVYEVAVGTPVANNACASTPMNTPVTGQLTATDPEGQPLTYSLVTQGGKGSVNLDMAGNYAYTPNSPDLRGLDKFTYLVTDSEGLTSTGSVWVIIDGAIRIMPLGDSITAGYLDSLITEDFWIGYRRKLYNDLSALNPALFGIDFVGTVTNLGASANPPLADRDNEGHDGWRDDEILNGADPGKQDPACPACNITDWLNSTHPDIVLLHIGTNGINNGGGTSSADVAAILDKIQAWETANSSPVTVMLARIIGSPDATTNTNVTTFNNNVAAMAQTRINNGDKIAIVNQQTGAELTYQLGAADGSPSGPDMGDNLHPNQDGYDKMADKWKADLISSGTLPSCP